MIPSSLLIILVGVLIIVLKSRNNAWASFGLLRPLPKEYLIPLEKYNTFYQSLPEKSKAIFRQKLNKFIYSKEFVPRQLPMVTAEMKALIGSAAVQLTFGLPNITLRHFKRILVYPDEYYSLINKQYHKGEVNPRLKTIVVSWRAFVFGYSDPFDGVNLGLHEMAHALKLENIIKNGEHHFFNLKDYEKWQELATIEIKKIRDGEPSIYRKYAGVDEDEFFAVSIELYFEQAKELREYNPELYNTLSNLLRQDTIRLIE